VRGRPRRQQPLPLDGDLIRATDHPIPPRGTRPAGWKATANGITTNSYEHPDHPGHVIGLSDEGAWAHNRFKLPKGIPGNPAYPPKDKGGRGKPQVALEHPETGEPVKTGDEATGPVSARQSSGKRDVSEREARPEAARGHSIIALPDLQPGQRAPAGIG